MESVLTKVTLQTAILKDLVAKAVKGSTMNPVIPLSCFMQVKVQDGVLYIRTTDNINFVTTKKEVENTPNFEIVVESKQFSATISKLSSEYTSLTIDGNSLTIEAGTGRYNMPLSVDSDGSNIKFPEPEFTPIGGSRVVTPTEMKAILSYNKASKAESREMPAIFNYYVDNECVITTNKTKACASAISFTEQPACIPPNLMELLPTVMDESGITIQENEDSILASSTIGTVYGKKCLPADVEVFPAAGAKSLFSQNASKEVSVPKQDLLNVLDRMLLFVDTLQYFRVDVTFTKDTLKIYDVNSKSVETISLLPNDLEEFDPITLPIDAKEFYAQVATVIPTVVNIGVTENFGIKINVPKSQDQGVDIKMMLAQVVVNTPVQG